MPVIQENITIKTHENPLAAAMYRHIGGVMMLNVEQAAAGTHTSDEFGWAVGDYATDPVGALAPAREALFAVGRDEQLPKQERQEKLGPYLDAYFDLTVQLDHAAFPEDAPGTSHERVPSYVPDGLVDMGRDARHDPNVRDREQIWVDKREILEKYKPLLTRIFAHDYGDATPRKRALIIANSIAREVYNTTTRAEQSVGGKLGLGGHKVELSKISEVLCRHQALLFQVVGQAAGLNTRVIKGIRMSQQGVENHAANFVEAGGEWALVDTSNPYATRNAQDEEVILPAVYPMEDGPLKRGEARRLSFTESTWGPVPKVRYIARDDMYWYVAHPAR